MRNGVVWHTGLGFSAKEGNKIRKIWSSFCSCMPQRRYEGETAAAGSWLVGKGIFHKLEQHVGLPVMHSPHVEGLHFARGKWYHAVCSGTHEDAGDRGILQPLLHGPEYASGLLTILL